MLENDLYDLARRELDIKKSKKRKIMKGLLAGAAAGHLTPLALSAIGYMYARKKYPNYPKKVVIDSMLKGLKYSLPAYTLTGAMLGATIPATLLAKTPRAGAVIGGLGGTAASVAPLLVNMGVRGLHGRELVERSLLGALLGSGIGSVMAG